MRKFLILIICSISFFGNAQDTLFFKDGGIKAVEIIKIDSVSALIEYKLNEQSVYGAIKSFDKIIYQGASLNLDYWASSKNDQSQELTDEQLRKNNPYSYGKFAISSNLTSFVSGFFREKRKWFYDNRVITIAPEYWVFDRLSVKLPISIGLDANLNSSPLEIDLETPITWSFFTKFEANLANLPPPTISHRRETYYWIEQNQGHRRNLQFQIGLAPKLYLTQQKKVMPYIGQSFNLAFVNLRTIDYQLTFSVQQNVNSNEYYHSMREEKQIISDSQTLLFKYEGMFGVDFNIAKRFNFSIEGGYSNSNMAENSIADRVYIRTSETGTFSLAHTENYNADERYKTGVAGRMFGRLHLVYRFGGQKNTASN
jgi:hypothetical protein